MQNHIKRSEDNVMKLTSRERLTRIFEKKEIDRPALKLWGAGLHTPSTQYLHPAYAPVGKLAAEKSDLFLTAGSAFSFNCGSRLGEFAEAYSEDTNNPTRKKCHTILHTPKGDLHMCNIYSTIGDPSYVLEHMVKEPEDIEKLLSLPYEPYPVDLNGFYQTEAVLGDRGVTVVIDKNLTPELIEEGNVREIISKIQTMRKDSGFEVMDNIKIAFTGNSVVEEIASRNAEEIKSETLGVELTVGNTLTHSKEWNINGENVTISVEKV